MTSVEKRTSEVKGFLDVSGKVGTLTKFRKNQTIFSQGDPAKSVLFIQKGNVQLSVINGAGKEAIVSILGPGDFFGERCLGAQPARMRTATAMTAVSIWGIEKNEMARLLHEHHALSARFITCMLTRNIRVEENLIEQYFDSAEKRLARKLLALARFGEGGQPQQVIPKVSPDTLAEMIGISRVKASHLMDKFKKLGFIDYTGKLMVYSSLLSVLLRD